ncbi:MAG: MerR family transcriptional regulator [Alphaproteobacteria bacterium]|nr:MerR family transcriptional regulator [Alphaproteobacteria bacterium]
MEKSPEAFKTISEAAEELGVEQHVLRFWETKFPQIKPLKRRGGRRFYRPEDMEILIRIQHLLHKQGFTIKGAKKALNAKDPASETATAVSEAHAAPLERKESRAKKSSTTQLDLLAQSDAPTPNAIGKDARKLLENVLSELKAARKDLQSNT